MSDTLKAFREAYKNLTAQDIAQLFDFCGVDDGEPMCEPDIHEALIYGDCECMDAETAKNCVVIVYSGLNLPQIKVKLMYSEPDEDGLCYLEGYEIMDREAQK